MPNIAANLTTLFTDVPLLERFARARAAGFRYVEVLFPYDEDVAVVAAQVRNGLQQVLFNIAAGNRLVGSAASRRIRHALTTSGPRWRVRSVGRRS